MSAELGPSLLPAGLVWFVKVIFGGVGDIQLLGQGGAVPLPGVGQLGAGGVAVRASTPATPEL